MLAHERKTIAEKECTRDPIFLLEVNRIQLPEESFETDLYVDGPEGGVFLTENSYARYMDTDFSDDDQAEEFWQTCETLSDTDLVSRGLAVQYWETDTIWLTREEAEQHAERRHYHYGKKGIDWRVYCVCAEGELAKLLINGIAKGTNYLPSTNKEAEWDKLRTT